MTSPVFRPTAPVPATWAPAGGWYGAGAASVAPPAPSAPSASSASADSDVQRWNEYVNEIRQAMQASAGFERVKLQKQYEDAEQGRQNAYRIAELQAKTSRYGVDRNTEVELARLKQNQSQFEANHGLEMQKFGLDRERFGFERERFGREFGLSEAETTGTYGGRPTESARRFDLTTEEGRRQYNESLKQRQYEYGSDYGLRRAQAIAQYSSTPDQMFMRSDLMSALGNAEAGYGPQPYGVTGDPQAKTTADFDAISGPPGSFDYGGGGAGYDPSRDPSLSAPVGPIDQTGAPIGGGGAHPPLDENSPQYRDIQARLAAGHLTADQAAAEWARLTGSPASQQSYAGGTSGFREGPGSGGGPAAPMQDETGGLTGYRDGPVLADRRTMAPAGASLGASRPMTGSDPRMTAASAVMRAIPPSETPGTSPDDMAALSAIRSLYFSRKPGTLARMRPGQQAAFGAGLSRLGYNRDDALAEMERANPGQRSVRMA